MAGSETRLHVERTATLSQLAGILVEVEGGKALLKRVREEFDRANVVARELRQQQHTYQTVLEVVREISLKALDIPRFEQYTINTVRGQFGVLKVLFLRQGDLADTALACHTARMAVAPDIELELQGAFCLALAEQGDVRDLDDPELAALPEAVALQKLGYVLVAPLLKRDEESGTALKGVLALGPRIGKLRYGALDRQFLTLLGGMIGVSLHNAHLYHRSIVDALTQVYSRGHFDIHLEQELERATRFNETANSADSDAAEASEPPERTGVTLVMLDIDHFKRFNDRYGHQIGDRVLFEVAQALKRSVRSMDIVCRYGGEEFGIIFPDATAEVAAPIAERIRQQVESHPTETREFGPLNVTVSLGVATYPDDASGVRNLIAAADAAMYESKAAGRNRVTRALRGPKPAARESPDGPA